MNVQAEIDPVLIFTVPFAWMETYDWKTWQIKESHMEKFEDYETHVFWTDVTIEFENGDPPSKDIGKMPAVRFYNESEYIEFKLKYL